MSLSPIQSTCPSPIFKIKQAAAPKRTTTAICSEPTEKVFLTSTPLHSELTWKDLAPSEKTKSGPLSEAKPEPIGLGTELPQSNFPPLISWHDQDWQLSQSTLPKIKPWHPEQSVDNEFSYKPGKVDPLMSSFLANLTSHVAPPTEHSTPAAPITLAAVDSLSSGPAQEAKAKTLELPTSAEKIRAQEIRASVNQKLFELGKLSVNYSVDEKLFPFLDKLKLDAGEFFLARACWQGVHKKRRRVLESVLDEYPRLPKDQKNWQAAVSAAQAKGTDVTACDKIFVQYFLENRKAMKSLFRATLAGVFPGQTAVCYRGQSNDPRYGAHSTRRMGCYSIDPNVSERWNEGSLKQYRVKVNHVWSTFTVTQNYLRGERELTVYSAGGTRKGVAVADLSRARSEFETRYAGNKLAKRLETLF